MWSSRKELKRRSRCYLTVVPLPGSCQIQLRGLAGPNAASVTHHRRQWLQFLDTTLGKGHVKPCTMMVGLELSSLHWTGGRRGCFFSQAFLVTPIPRFFHTYLGFEAREARSCEKCCECATFSLSGTIRELNGDGHTPASQSREPPRDKVNTISTATKYSALHDHS